MLHSITLFLFSFALPLQQVDIGTMNAFNNEALKLGLMGSTILVSSGEPSHTLLYFSRGGTARHHYFCDVVKGISTPPPPHHYKDRQIRCSLSQK
jgi:hypothetical protein